MTLEDVARAVGRTPRAVRYWIERRELDAYAVGQSLWVVDEWQLAGWLVGRLELYRAWVQGVYPGRRPRRGWEIRRGERYLRATVHAQVDSTPDGPRPYRAHTWLVGWTGSEAGTMAERTYRSRNPLHWRRWAAGELLRMWESEPVLRAWRSRAWQPEQVPIEQYHGAPEPGRSVPAHPPGRLAAARAKWPFRGRSLPVWKLRETMQEGDPR